MGLKRKHEDSKEESRALVERIIQLEAGILSSQDNLNDIRDIITTAKSDNIEVVFASVHALGRIFAALWKKGLLNRNKDDSASAQVSDWLRGNYNAYIDILKAMLRQQDASLQSTALKQLLPALQSEGENASAVSGKYEFPNTSYLAIVDLVLNSSEASDYLLRILADSYLNSYDDLRFYFYRNVAKIGSPDYDPFKSNRSKSGARAHSLITESEAFAKNTFAVMSMIRVMPKESNHDISSFWVGNPIDYVKDQQINVLSPAAHKKAFGEAWLAYMRQSLSAEAYKQVLLILHKRIIPYMVDARGLLDFLTNAYDAGGSVSLLALNGLFTLMDQYNLNYPQFYEKLYALLDRNLFHVKYRARFFRLLDLFLGSPLLPAYLIAAFAKRISRLALSATPAGAVIAIPLVYNLLKDHPSCMVLIHRMPGYDEETGEEMVSEETDPYLPNEVDPAKSLAIQSSLWEIETLQSHYYPNIATLAKIFSEPFHKPKFVMEDFLDHTYTTFFESDTVRKPKRAPALATQPPAGLLRSGDALGDFLAF